MRKSLPFVSAAAAVAVFGFSPDASAQSGVFPTPATVELLTVTRRPFPGTNPPFTPTATGYSSTAVRSNGTGFALTGTGGSNLRFAWGNPSAPTLAGSQFLAFQTDYTPQQSFLPGIGLSGTGDVVLATGSNLLVNNTIAASIGQSIPAGLKTSLGLDSSLDYTFSGHFSGLGYRGSDPVYRLGWRNPGSTATAPAGLAFVRGLGGNAEVLAHTGQLLPGLPTPLTNAVGDFQVEAFTHANTGDNWTGRLSISTDTAQGIESNARQVVVRNGTPVTVGGDLVRLRTPVNDPTARDNEIWFGFNNTAVAGGDDWGFVGQTFQLGTASSQQAVAVVNGAVAFRQGQDVTHDGATYRLGASVGQIAMNTDGDWALPWLATDLATNASTGLLFVNGVPVVVENLTTYSLDGQTTSVSSFSYGNLRVALTDRNQDDEVSALYVGFLPEPSPDFGYFVATTTVPEPAAAALFAPTLLVLRRRRF